MRIAFLTSRYPYPLISGGRLRTHFALRYLSRSHQVTVYAIEPRVAGGADFPPEEPPGLTTKFFRISSAGYARNALKGLFSDLPFQVKLYESADLLRDLSADVACGRIDLLFVHLLRMAEYVRPFSHIPRIIDLVDSICLHYQRMPRIWYSPGWLAARADRERVCRHEAQLSASFNAVLLASPVDLAALRRRTGAENLILIPNGVEVSALPSPLKAPELNRIIFFGTLDYLPNVDAAVYFAREILPLIRKKVPKVRLHVAGWNPPRAVRLLARIEGVIVQANVPDLRAEVSKSVLSVAPLRFGAGTQFKILESLALGVPVVATPEPARALGGDAAGGILIGRNPEEFSHQVVRLLSDESYRERMGKAGHSFVESRYSWERVFAPLDGVLKAIECGAHAKSAANHDQRPA